MMFPIRIRVCARCIFALVFLVPTWAHAEVRLPGFFGDHMVLQQQLEIRIWGWADVGESVKVQLGDASTTVTADNAGKWLATLPPRTASKTPFTLKATGSNTIEIHDVLIGEVWLCSGQSNMEWTVRISNDAAEEIAAAKFPLIRHMKVQHRPSTRPIDDIDADWQLCGPDTVGDFTAVGYFMARKLHQELDVPIGLINSSWGGTRVEPWTPPLGFEQVDALQDIHTSVLTRTPSSPAYKQRLQQHIGQVEAWLGQAKDALDSGADLAASPAYPSELTSFTSHQDPTMLYNGMIHALVGFPIRGAIWYQGESNHNEGMLYFEKKKALIGGWRELWGQGDFPFYYIQIAPYQYGNEDPTILAEFWEAQARVEELPRTEMVVINDIATLNDIHPPNKQDVGLRLANIALKNDYGRGELVVSSPELDRYELQPDSILLKFKHTAGGLKTRDGQPPTHFEVIGVSSGGFQAAQAEILGDSVKLTADAVKTPVAFRFAWHKLAEPNLVGGTGLPVGAFRGGEVPDFADSVPHADDYQLVYEIDLNKLEGNVNYAVDDSKTVGEFDRVAYLLELSSKEFGEQAVFVSAKAFTNNVQHIGIPTAASGATFQQSLDEMQVFSTVDRLNTGDQPVKGAIEFWPHNYATQNSASVPHASDSAYDFGDTPAEPRNGYGSMQIHHPANRETVFAINHWNQGGDADIGIGNSPGNNPDWTFSGNASSYSQKKLRVFVRPVNRVAAAGARQIVPAASLPKSTPWDLARLRETPPHTWSEGTQIRSLYYEGEPYQGKPTRVFAYYATPATIAGKPNQKTKFPAVVLVHGGGGTAFSEWVELWARRGYAAIAMDLAGCGPNRVRLDDGGPGQGHDMKFSTIDLPVTEQWTYHAVANVLRAHSLIRSFPEVDTSRTAVTGISWGGYLTCIVAGLDDRFEAAVPVYGCGFLHDNSVWLNEFAKMTATQKAKWIELWDPSQYAGSATMPVLLVNGGKDFAYPPDSHAKTFGLVKSPKYLHFVPDLAHGHIFDRPKAIEHFIASRLTGGEPLPVVSPASVHDGKATASVQSNVKLLDAQLHFTTDAMSNDPRTRKWETKPAELGVASGGSTITAELPPDDATVWFFTVRDHREAVVSSPLVVR